MDTVYIIYMLLLLVGGSSCFDENDEDDKDFSESTQRLFRDPDYLAQFVDDLNYISGMINHNNPLLYDLKAFQFVKKYRSAPFVKVFRYYVKSDDEFKWFIEEWSRWLEKTNDPPPVDDWVDSSIRLKHSKFLIHCVNKSAIEGLSYFKALISDLINGAGLCRYFMHPNSVIEDDRKVALRKLLFFISKNEYVFLDGEIEIYDEIYKIISLARMCRQISMNPLAKAQREAILYAFLKGELSINSLSQSNSKKRVVCNKFFGQDAVDKFKTRYPESTQLILIDGCIPRFYAIIKDAFMMPEIQVHKGCVFDRWFKRLSEFANRHFELNLDMNLYLEQLDLDKNKNFDSYLRAIIEEVPTADAHLTYTRGEGYICALFNKKPFSGIATVQSLLKLHYDRGAESLKNGTEKHKIISNFALLYATCKNLANKFGHQIQHSLLDKLRLVLKRRS